MRKCGRNGNGRKPNENEEEKIMRERKE